MRGVLDLAATDQLVPGQDVNCAGMNDYSDIKRGAAVTVYDAGGKIVAEGVLDSGNFAEPTSHMGDCFFPFAVPGVPKGAKSYQVEFSHRGKLTASVAEARSGTFGATLGG